MGKRARPGRTGGSAQAQFDKILATIPARAEFHITMAADSTDEVWDDIDTNLQDGEAWLVYGGYWIVESIDPEIILRINAMEEDITQGYALQVHRNDDSEILLNFNDDDLMFEDRILCAMDLDTNGGRGVVLNFPRFFGERTITFSEKLRVLFRSAADDPSISVATAQIAGCLLYDRITAPSIGQSKLGQIADL